MNGNERGVINHRETSNMANSIVTRGGVYDAARLALVNACKNQKYIIGNRVKERIKGKRALL